MPTHLCPALGKLASQKGVESTTAGSLVDLLAPKDATSSLKQLDSVLGFIISALLTKSPWICVSISFLTPGMSIAR